MFVESEDDPMQELQRAKGGLRASIRDKGLPYWSANIVEEVDGIHERLVACW